ncbi:MAG: hypothetical protein ACRDG7_04875 [Candidatus Limnocylindria bacterium]
MTDAGLRQVTRVSAYAVCRDEADRILYRCHVTGGELRDEPEGSTDACAWFARSDLPMDRLVDIAQLAVGLVL